MLNRIALLLILICLEITIAQAEFNLNTIGASGGLLAGLVRNQVDADTAKTLISTSYKGSYQISGKVIGKKMTFENIKSKQSYPDSRWAREALDIARLAETPIYTTGSHIAPRATAYVVFYPWDIEGINRSALKHVPSYQPGNPNTLVMLVVKHKNHSRSRNDISKPGGQMGNKFTLTGTNIYFFKMTL